MDAVKLTKRESEIAELFAWGASKKEIANRLFISERTVENHARRIFEKTGLSLSGPVSDGLVGFEPVWSGLSVV